VKIVITMDLEPEHVDADHPMGVTEKAYDAIADALMEFGSDIAVRRAEEE
jgi:hypothetical protein